MSDCMQFLFGLVSDCYNIVLPWGITFGAIVVAVFGLPILVKAFRKLMG